MQGYLSDVTARWLLMELTRTTLLVAVLGAAAWLVLRLARVSSPALHRVCCVMVLLAGWTLMRWPVEVAWYEAPPEVVAAVAEVKAEPEPEPESFTPPIDPKLLSPPPEFGAAIGAPVTVEPEAAAVAVALEAVQQPEPIAVVEAAPAWSFTWEQVAVAGWLGGVVAVVGWWLVGYVRFLWQMPRGLEGEPEWQAEFAAARAEQGRAGRVEFRVTEDAGPLLCRLPRRTVLLVPRVMWSELDAVERRAILRHELEHLSRGDLWKSLAVRVLALPHWFNPVAWLAVRRFDDAAEWACDRAAMNEQPTAYAAMLLRLGELAGTRARFGSAMSNRPLTTRIRRLLTINGTEDSAMKKACLLSLLFVVAPLALVRVNLVAEEPAQEVTRDQAEHGQETPKPTSDVGIGYPPVFPTEEQMKATSAENAPPAEPPAAEPETPVKAAQRKMVEFAKKTYEANDAAYKAGTITLDQLFHWSTLWLNAELAIAESREEQIAAAERNLARLKVVEANIRRLYEQGSRGGEQNAMSAANYHVADAERRLAEIEAMPEPVIDASKPNAFVPDLRAQLTPVETYQGQTFAQWTKSFKSVLDFETRKEALAAFRLFAVNGHGKEIAELLIATLGPMMPDSLEKNRSRDRDGHRAAELQDEQAIELVLLGVATLQRIPRDELMPVLAQALENGVTGERRFAMFAAPDKIQELLPIYLNLMRDSDAVVAELAIMKANSISAAQVSGEFKAAVDFPRSESMWAIQRLPVLIKVNPTLAPLCGGLVHLLGSEDEQIRDAAFLSLQAIGVEARPALEEGSKTATGQAAAAITDLLSAIPPEERLGIQPSPPARGNANATPSLAPTTTETVPSTGNTYRRSREFHEGMPTLLEKVELHYDGKTFDQWRTQLQTDLSPVLRKEAMYAMAEFAAHGYGKEAAAVIFETAKNYPATRTRNTFENEVQTAAIYAASRVPGADILPLIAKRLESDDPQERLFAIQVVPLEPPQPGVAELLEKAMDDSDPRVAREARAFLSRADWANAKLDKWIREALGKQDWPSIGEAMGLVMGDHWSTPLGREFYRQPYPEKFPEVIALLNHSDEKIRENATAGLQGIVHRNERARSALKGLVADRTDPEFDGIRKILGLTPIDRRR